MAIDTHWRVRFADMVRLKAMTTESVLAKTCMKETLDAEKVFWDYYGGITPTERTLRNAENPYSEIERERRMIQPAQYEWAEIYSKLDTIRLNRQVMPDSRLVEAVVNGFEQKQDELIITAFGATAYSGKDGTTATAFDTSAQVVAKNYGDAGSADVNLTIAKVRKARAIMETGKCSPKIPWYIAAHPTAKQNLLKSAKLTNEDYAEVKALVYGEINQYLGFNFVWTPLIPTYTTNERYAWAYTAEAMLCGASEDIEVKIEEIPDRGYGTQLYVNMVFAATRAQENQIVRIAHIDNTFQVED